METYNTEEEQIEAIKRWWRENGKSTLAAVALALAVVFGWRYWQDYQFNHAAEASAMFDQLLVADAQVQESGDVTSTAETLAETVKSAFSGLSYGQFAAMYKAKYAVMKGDYPAAIEELEWVLEQKPEAAVAAQAKLRLAHVFFAQGELDQALSLLDKLAKGGSAPDALELKGDILLEQGDEDAALSAYQAARDAVAKQQVPGQHTLLEMKINDLSSAYQGGES